MGRRKNPVPVKRGRVSLSFNLSDPMQRYAYNYLAGNRGNATKIVVNAIIQGQNADTKKATEFVPNTHNSVADTKPSIKVERDLSGSAKQVNYFAGPDASVSAPSFESVEEGVGDDFLEDALDAFGDA